MRYVSMAHARQAHGSCAAHAILVLYLRFTCLYCAAEKQKPPRGLSALGPPARSHPPARPLQIYTTVINAYYTRDNSSPLRRHVLSLDMSLPAYPWQQRPEDLPLTAEEVCAALYEAEGDVTAASHAAESWLARPAQVHRALEPRPGGHPRDGQSAGGQGAIASSARPSTTRTIVGWIGRSATS